MFKKINANKRLKTLRKFLFNEKFKNTPLFNRLNVLKYVFLYQMSLNAIKMPLIFFRVNLFNRDSIILQKTTPKLSFCFVALTYLS